MLEQFMTIGIPAIVAILLALLWYNFSSLQRHIYRFAALKEIYRVLDITNVKFKQTRNTIPEIEGQSLTINNNSMSTSVTTKWAIIYRDFFEETFHGSATETQMTIAVAILELLVLFAINLLVPPSTTSANWVLWVNLAVILISIVGVLIMFYREYLTFKRKFATHVELLVGE